MLQLRQQYGENRLPAEKGTTVWTILLNQIKSPLVYIILVAAAVSFIVKEYNDFAIIMAVVVIDVILGFIQEYQAQQTYTALKGLLKPTTTVIRDGNRQEVEVWELVPGDVVLLNSGEHVPADGEITESTKLAVDEAILTGESEPVSKNESDGHNLVLYGYDHHHWAGDNGGDQNWLQNRARSDCHQPAGACRRRYPTPDTA